MTDTIRVGFLLTLILYSICGNTQTTYKKHRITSEKVEVINPRGAEAYFNPMLINLEAPSPDGDSYRSFLMRQKIKLRELYPQNAESYIPKKSRGLQPTLGTGVRIHRLLPDGTQLNIPMGIPNDNTIAVSNDGIVLASTNSIVWAYDTNKDSIHFNDQFKSLKSIGGGASGDRPFDPKLIYDRDADRFILVYLENNTPANSRVKVCFSSSSDPEDPWYSYTLPGNPLNNDRWTDFPAIAITENELFLTVNLLIPGLSWQLGFDGSVIWQMDKARGFSGDSVLNNTLWTDIKHDGKYIRNLHPVQGSESDAPEAYFLSNRNFDLSNDTIFLLHITGVQYDSSTTLNIKTLTTTPDYGMPPNGRQEDTDLSDPTKGLATNDARVLGAITNGDWIQFVSNTLNPATGFAGVYHGFIADPAGIPSITGNIIAHPTRDYAYPNIAWTGDEDCDIETMIGFDYASPTDFPGVGIIYFGNDSSYSDPLDIKKGENYTDRHSDSYERWGDYFGIQRKYNEPKTVWLAGYYGDQNNVNQTWIAQVFSSDTSVMKLAVTQSGNPLFCTGEIEITPVGGMPPYEYSFDHESFTATNRKTQLCSGVITFTAVDSRGCSITDSITLEKFVAAQQPAAFPNPFMSHLVVQFNLAVDQDISVVISDMAGNVISTVLEQPAKSGQNELIFSLEPLAIGQYLLSIEGSSGFKMTEKLIKSSN